MKTNDPFERRPKALSLRAVEIDRILDRIAGPYNELVYVGKDYTIAQLEADLTALRVMKR